MPPTLSSCSTGRRWAPAAPRRHRYGPLRGTHRLHRHRQAHVPLRQRRVAEGRERGRLAGAVRGPGGVAARVHRRGHYRGGIFWDAGAQVFIHKGTNGRWADTLTPEDVAEYEARAVRELGPECARWLATGEGPASD